jgi:ribosomal protein S18 acetylase RimI-like enzyme
MRVTLQTGLPPNLRDAAAALYWQAFGGKLGVVMGPDPKALQFLARVLRADHAIVALDQDGQLVGLAGFKTPAGSFAGGEAADVAAVYGLFGAAWRLPLLWLLGNDIDNDRFLLDGICVAKSQRGRGIGSALMRAIDAEAVARGYAHVRLDVIDSNWRAKALYERLGFAVEKTESIGLLRHIFGFRSAITMVKPLF